MLKHFFYKLGRLGLFFVPVIGALLVGIYWYKAAFVWPLDKGSKGEVIFSIEKDWNSDKIFAELEKRKIVRSAWALSQKAKSRKNFQISLGEYSLSPNMTPDQVLDRISSKTFVEYTVQIAPGSDMAQIAKAIAATNLITEKEALEAMHNQGLMVRSGVPSFIAEGYMIEGPYYFSRPITPERIISVIIEQTRGNLDLNHEGWQTRARQLGLQPHEFLTLASLVEKETSDSDERRNVSSVFHNRLKLEMPLESRAALRYGKKDPNSPITSEDINSSGPYNTFGKNKRLPTTPICTPSHNAIDATLQPAVTDYLYFLKTASGKLEFAPTLRQYKQLLAENGQGEAPPQKPTTEPATEASAQTQGKEPTAADLKALQE